MIGEDPLQSTDLFIGQIEQQRDLGRRAVRRRPLHSFCLTGRHAQRPVPTTATAAAKPLDLQYNEKVLSVHITCESFIDH